MIDTVSDEQVDKHNIGRVDEGNVLHGKEIFKNQKRERESKMSLIHGTINEGHLLQMKVKMAVNNHCRFGEVYFLKKQPINQNISCIGFSTLYKNSLILTAIILSTLDIGKPNEIIRNGYFALR